MPLGSPPWYRWQWVYRRLHKVPTDSDSMTMWGTVGRATVQLHQLETWTSEGMGACGFGGLKATGLSGAGSASPTTTIAWHLQRVLIAES